jgi:hypothetical protein
MELVAVRDPQAAAELVSAAHQPDNVIIVDEASVLIVEDGERYRLPKNDRFVSTRSAKTNSGDSLEDVLGESLAIGASVSASSTHLDYSAEQAIDGSLADDDRWIGRNEGDTWIELDLGESKTISSIWIVTGWKQSRQYVADDFEVQVKRGDEWHTLAGGTIRENSRIQLGIDLETPVHAQHVRLVSDTNDFFRIYEIALFDRKLDIATDLADFGVARICREVATERDLLNLHGTFYELPARNAQGLAKVRPVCTHNLAIHDFCSHNGLLLFTGIDADTESDHVFRSADGKAAVWAGVVDDLWELGKPRGRGGPWHNTKVQPGEPSDRYLMTAYDQKSVTISSTAKATIRLEVDVDGTGLWIPYEAFELTAGQSIEHAFPEGFSAYWVRAVSDAETTATVTLTYQ